MVRYKQLLNLRKGTFALGLSTHALVISLDKLIVALTFWDWVVVNVRSFDRQGKVNTVRRSGPISLIRIASAR